MSYTAENSASSAGKRADLRQLIASQGCAHGAWCMIPSALNVEVIACAGVDWLCVDLQHGLIDDAALHQMLHAAGVHRTPVLVRVPWNDPASIMRALDAGADGVIVPMVNTVEEARIAGEATRFPPAGNRSWGPLRPALLRPGFDPASANAAAICLVMVETTEAVEELDEILDTPSIDGIFVGPKDLALSHRGAITDTFDHPWSQSVFKRVAEGCRRRQLVAATICDTVEQAERMRELGFSLLAVQTDASWLGATAASTMDAVRGPEPGQ